jgi:hypothetical protein
MAIDFSSTVLVIVTIMAFTFMLKMNNILYRITLTLLGASSIGYLVCQALNNFYYTNIVTLSKGDYSQILAIVLGFMMLFTFIKSLNFIARFSSVFLIAANLGVTAAGTIAAQIYQQAASPVNNTDQLIVAIIAIFVLVYFITTFKLGGSIGYITRYGIFPLMFYFGFMWGAMMLSNISLLLSRIQYIIWTWLEIAH